MSFAQMGLSPSLLRALEQEGYQTPTPIQAQAIPQILAGRDLMGSAQTGTGKTAAFALPILHGLGSHPIAHGDGHRRPIRTLVLAPTRELAAQINESFRNYGRHCGLRATVIFGGVGQNPQVNALRNGVDIVIATPGRLLDLMNQGHVDLRGLKHLVLDEADNMLDMGFIHDIRKIIARVPERRQTLMFSATMPPDIRQLADAILKNPVRVQVAPVATTADKVRQSVCFVEKTQKPALLHHYLKKPGFDRVLVFTRTKHGADRVVRHLLKLGITAAAIHGNKSQNARLRALTSFKSDRPPVLVATDIAARGLDIDAVSHVINYEIPNVPETYVHRIGRTARAGAEGIAVSFCDSEERAFLRDIEKLTRQQIPVEQVVQLPKVDPMHRPIGQHPQRPPVQQHAALAPQHQQPRRAQGPNGQPRADRHAPATAPRPQHGNAPKWAKPAHPAAKPTGRFRKNRRLRRWAQRQTS